MKLRMRKHGVKKTNMKRIDGWKTRKPNEDAHPENRLETTRENLTRGRQQLAETWGNVMIKLFLGSIS